MNTSGTTQTASIASTATPTVTPTATTSTPATGVSWFSSLFGSKPKQVLSSNPLFVSQGGRRRRGKKTQRKRMVKKTRKHKKY